MSWQDDAMIEQEIADDFNTMSDSEIREIIKPDFRKRLFEKDKKTI